MRLEAFSKYFPLPNFLKPNHFGLSFSDSNIKAIMFDGPLPKPELKSILVPLEKGTIHDGNILNFDELVKKLLMVKEKINLPFVFSALPDELTYIYSTSLFITKATDLTEAVAATIEENVPLSLSDTIFDFNPIEIKQNGKGYDVLVIVSACVKKEVNKFIDVLLAAGLEPIGCIHESQAIANSVIPQNYVGTSCIVHARSNRVGIYLVRGKFVHFATLRNIAEGDFKNQFLDEYDKFIEYSLRYKKDQEESFKNIFVCGEFEAAKKVLETIVAKNNFINNTKLANVWSNVLKIEKDPPSIPYEESLNLAGPIGSILNEII